jgi:hypothetical protein
MSRWGNKEITQAVPFIIHTIGVIVPRGEKFEYLKISLVLEKGGNKLSITRGSNTFLEGWRLYTVKKVSSNRQNR